MTNQKNVPVLILEKDPAVIDAVKDALEKGPYSPYILSNLTEALSSLKTGHFSIAIVGDAEETNSPFEGLLDMVKASPLTSIILLTDLPHEEVHERAEGCGILGHVSRSVPPEDLEALLNHYRKIASLL